MQSKKDFYVNINVYYCICDEYLLIINNSLENLSRRRTDNSFIISSDYIINAREDENEIFVRIKGDSVERRKLFKCANCNLTVAYKCNGDNVLYFLDESAVLKQGEGVPNQWMEKWKSTIKLN
jgi:hypothetical protein